MLNDEEKQAIEYVKNIKKWWWDNTPNRVYAINKNDIEQFDVILNLIEKQSKEIERLNKKITRYEKIIENKDKKCEELLEYEETEKEIDYVSKDKIKSKIEELERDKNKLYKEQGNIEEIKIYSVVDIIKAEILRFKELLEKE